MDVSWQASIYSENLKFIDEMSQSPEAKALNFSNYLKDITGGRAYIEITGSGATTKTVAMARAAKELMDKGRSVLPFFYDATQGYFDAENLVRYLVYKLEDFLGYSDHFGEDLKEALFFGERRIDYNDWLRRLHNLLREYSMRPDLKMLYIFVDGENLLNPELHLDSDGIFKWGAHRRIKVVSTDLERETPYPVLQSPVRIFRKALGQPFKTEAVILKSDKNQVIKRGRTYFKNYGIELNSSSQNTLLRFRDIGNPIFSDLLYKYFDLKVEQERGKNLKPNVVKILKDARKLKTLQSLSRSYINTLDNFYPQMEIKRTLSLLSLSPKGLDPYTLRALKGSGTIKQTQSLMQFLKEKMGWILLEHSDGRLQLNPHYADTLNFDLGLGEDEAQELSLRLYEELISRPLDNSFRIETFRHWAKMENSDLEMLNYIQEAKAKERKDVLDRLAFEMLQLNKIKHSGKEAALAGLDIEELLIEDKQDLLSFLNGEYMKQFELGFLSQANINSVVSRVSQALMDSLAEDSVSLGPQTELYRRTLRLQEGTAMMANRNYEEAERIFKNELRDLASLDEKVLRQLPPLTLPTVHLHLVDLYEHKKQPKLKRRHIDAIHLLMRDLPRNLDHDSLAPFKQVDAMSSGNIFNTEAAEMAHYVGVGLECLAEGDLEDAKLFLNTALSFTQGHPYYGDDQEIRLLQIRVSDAMAQFHLAFGQVEQAKEYIENFLEDFKNARFPSDVVKKWELAHKHINALLFLGDVSMDEGRWDDAWDLYQQSLSIARRSVRMKEKDGPVEEDYLAVLERLAKLALKEGDYEALQLLDERIINFRQFTKSLTPLFFQSKAYDREALRYFRELDYENALESVREALAIQTQTDLKESITAAKLSKATGVSYKILGDLKTLYHQPYETTNEWHDKADEYYESALEQFEMHKDSVPSSWDDGLVMEIHLKRAENSRTPQGQLDSLINALRFADSALEKDKNPDVIVGKLQTLSRIAEICFEHGEYKKAYSYLQQWIKDYKEFKPKVDRHESMEVRMLMGEALERMKKYDSAKRTFQKVVLNVSGIPQTDRTLVERNLLDEAISELNEIKPLLKSH